MAVTKLQPGKLYKIEDKGGWNPWSVTSVVHDPYDWSGVLYEGEMFLCVEYVGTDRDRLSPSNVYVYRILTASGPCYARFAVNADDLLVFGKELEELT